MDAAAAALWSSALICVAAVGALAAHYRFQVKRKAIAEGRAKAIYSWACMAIGLFCGTVIFFGIMLLFNIPAGHGEVLIAAPIFNLMLSAISVVIGRIVIGWMPMKW
jgi:hypothetical protein